MRFKQEDLAGMTARPAQVAPMRTTPIPAAAASSASASAKAGMQALGRLKPGELNKTEQRFVDEWLKPQMQAGAIKWWLFEAITLKLAPDCRLTVDFFVLMADDTLRAYDVKGAVAIISDDAKVKMRIAADRFPWPFFYAIPRAKKDGGGWEAREV